jgi:hypothetical protein
MPGVKDDPAFKKMVSRATRVKKSPMDQHDFIEYLSRVKSRPKERQKARSTNREMSRR